MDSLVSSARRFNRSQAKIDRSPAQVVPALLELMELMSTLAPRISGSLLVLRKKEVECSPPSNLIPLGFDAYKRPTAQARPDVSAHPGTASGGPPKTPRRLVRVGTSTSAPSPSTTPPFHHMNRCRAPNHILGEKSGLDKSQRP